MQRRGVGKPRHVYSITSAAEYLLSAAYAPALNAVLAAVASRADGELPALLRDAGDALFHEMQLAEGPRTVKAAGDALALLGRTVRIMKSDGAGVLTTQWCPLGSVSSRSPHVCVLVEALLTSSERHGRAGSVRPWRCSQVPIRD